MLLFHLAVQWVSKKERDGDEEVFFFPLGVSSAAQGELSQTVAQLMTDHRDIARDVEKGRAIKKDQPR